MLVLISSNVDKLNDTNTKETLKTVKMSSTFGEKILPYYCSTRDFSAFTFVFLRFFPVLFAFLTLYTDFSFCFMFVITEHYRIWRCTVHTAIKRFGVRRARCLFLWLIAVRSPTLEAN